MITEENSGNDNFLTKQSPFLSPNFIRGSTVIVIPNNVELCKQYFFQEYLLLIRRSCNWFSVIALMEKDQPLWELKLVETEKSINLYCKQTTQKS